MEDRYAKVGDVNIRYRVMGSGSPIILIHGIGASVRYWQYNIKFLSQYYRVYAIDLVGFGHSDKPKTEYSPAYFSNFVASFMDSQNVSRACLVGNSMGGLVCLQFAIDYNERVDKLVLVDTSGLGPELIWVLRLMTLPMLGEVLYGPNKIMTRLFHRMLFYDKRFVTDEWVEQNLEVARLPGAKSSFLSVLRYGVNFRGLGPKVLKPLLVHIPRITTPTLIVWGAQDRIIPVSHAYIGHKIITNSQLHVFNQCGHLPQIEKAEGFNRLVTEFLAAPSQK